MSSIVISKLILNSVFLF